MSMKISYSILTPVSRVYLILNYYAYLIFPFISNNLNFKSGCSAVAGIQLFYNFFSTTMYRIRDDHSIIQHGCISYETITALFSTVTFL